MDDFGRYLTDAVIWIMGLSALIHLIVSTALDEQIIQSSLVF